MPRKRPLVFKTSAPPLELYHPRIQKAPRMCLVRRARIALVLFLAQPNGRATLAGSRLLGDYAANVHVTTISQFFFVVKPESCVGSDA